jgi:hypothetical protein
VDYHSSRKSKPLPKGRGFSHEPKSLVSSTEFWFQQVELYGRHSVEHAAKQSEITMLSTILVVILILILIGALPTWGYSSGWGYGPGGVAGLLLIIVIVLALTGRI